jgi:two-component system, cell cycle response regulator DivK
MTHILIIEDNRDNREVTELILADAGYTVVSAGDGIRGLAIAMHAQPDLILMDLTLPHLDGWETTRQLKANPATRHIPIIALTAHLLQDDIARAVAAGCVAVIAKPFEISTFLSQVEAVLAQRGRQRAVGADRKA